VQATAQALYRYERTHWVRLAFVTYSKMV